MNEVQDQFARPRQPSRQGLVEFWRCTWSAWRSGALSKLSPAYADSAAGDFEMFTKLSPDAKDALINEFFTSHKPHLEEFLIFYTKSGNKVRCVLTSQRLWV